MRVINRFFGIRDFPYLKLGIRDFKAKSGKIRDWKYARELKDPKKSSGLRNCKKFLVGITGLKNPIGDPQRSKFNEKLKLHFAKYWQNRRSIWMITPYVFIHRRSRYKVRPTWWKDDDSSVLTITRNVSFPTLLSWYNDFSYADDKTNFFGIQRRNFVS